MARGLQPADADFHDATWNDDATRAGMLVGPGAGGTVYPAGRYLAWWTCPDNPEVPQRPAPEPGAGRHRC